MKADLYTTHVGAAGAGALAHRTAAGFAVLTSSDGKHIIELIEAKQSESDLIDQIVAAVQDAATAPNAFSMLFTAGGNLYLIATGAANVTIESASMRIGISAISDHVIVHPVSAGLNEASAVITMYIGDEAGGATGTDLRAGTSPANTVRVAVGSDMLPPPDPAPDHAAQGATASVEPAAVEPARDPAVELLPEPAADPEPAAELATEPAADPEPAAELLPEPAADPEAAAELDESAADPEPAAELDASVPEAEPAPDEESFDAADGASPTDDPPAEEPSPAVSMAGPVMVLGVACAQGHHNHPDAVYCSQCGVKMDPQHTTVLLNGPRPPLGVLVADDGTTYSLSQDLVIGREPTSHAGVVAGTASPMILTDDTLSLSRTHARVQLDDWSVYIEDLGSSNGTFVSRAEMGESWTRVEPTTRTELEPGDRLRVGARVIQVELHHVK